jgi:hypothetical protein
MHGDPRQFRRSRDAKQFVEEPGMGLVDRMTADFWVGVRRPFSTVKGSGSNAKRRTRSGAESFRFGPPRTESLVAEPVRSIDMNQCAACVSVGAEPDDTL